MIRNSKEINMKEDFERTKRDLMVGGLFQSSLLAFLKVKSKTSSLRVQSEGPALMAEWSRALPLTACCLSPLRACPDG